ncbi:MAG: hypothetical protein WCO40_11320 [Thermoleophilia bacterium]
MPTQPNATSDLPVTALRLDTVLKERIEVVRGEIARATPGLSPSFSATVRVLINEALDARAIAAVASPPDALLAAALADAKRVYFAALDAIDIVGLGADACFAALAAALAEAHAAVSASAVASFDAAVSADFAADFVDRHAKHLAAVPVSTGRGAGGIVLHRAKNGASVATVIANDP